jgi:uncharacterized RDD family membrane protein YckC
MIQNSQSYELADIGDRAFALLIDSMILSLVGGIFGFGTASLFGGSLIGLLIGVAYQWYFLTQRGGQTPGKMLMNIRVIKADGSPISDADAIVRYIGYLINSPILLLGWLWATWDGKNQGWHDKLANTYVVRASRDEVPVKIKNDTL